jgi:4'-phosphopantetheinyl transferase
MSGVPSLSAGSDREGDGAHGSIVIDLHRWCLDTSEAQRAALARHLCPDELARASRFLLECHRDRYIVGRGRLREILAGYVGKEPGSLRFEYGTHGKPRLSFDGAGSISSGYGR